MKFQENICSLLYNQKLEVQVMEDSNLKTTKSSYVKELLALFLMFLKLGAFTFGGGYAMISLIKENIVEKKKWIDEEEMLEIIGIAESTPGPIAINMATFIGYKRAKVLGSIVSTLGVVLPSLIIIFTISLFFEQFLQNIYVKFAFSGIKIGVGILILNAGIDMIKKVEKKIIPILMLIAIIVFMILMEVLEISFSSIYLILIGGIIGLFVYSLKNIKARDKNDLT